MKRTTRILILLLALCMIIPCIAACNNNKGGGHKTPAPTDNNGQQNNPSNDNSGNNGNSGNGGNEGNEGNEGNGDTTTTPPEENIILPEVVDMDGYVYRAYVRDQAGTSPTAHAAQIANGNNDYRCVDFWVDEANSENDVISFAVYQRNKQIEADYNCKIRQVSSDGSQIEHLLSAFINGEGYDLTIITAKPAAQAATQNLLRNLYDMENLDLSHESFDQNAINELRVGDNCISPAVI